MLNIECSDFPVECLIWQCRPPYQVTLDTIWEKFEEFCKPQSNEVRARFDLLTKFWQGNKSVDEWYNAVQTQVALAKYSPETAKILHMDIFCSSLKVKSLLPDNK